MRVDQPLGRFIRAAYVLMVIIVVNLKTLGFETDFYEGQREKRNHRKREETVFFPGLREPRLRKKTPLAVRPTADSTKK